MGFEEFFDFDEDSYETTISQLSEEALRREHAIVRQKCISAKASAGAGAAGAFHTLGASLLLSGVGLRRNSYNKQKREIVERRMRKEGWATSELRKRDVLMAVGPSAAAACIAPGVDCLTGHLAGHAASHFAGQHAADTVSVAMHNPVPFAHAVEQGFSNQVSAVAHGLTGHAVQLIPIESVASNTPEFLGNVVGQALASTAEIEGTRRAVKTAAGWGFNKYANPAIPPTRPRSEIGADSRMPSTRVCDNCYDWIYDEWWHCDSCYDFDYCASCYMNSRSSHTGGHSFKLNYV